MWIKSLFTLFALLPGFLNPTFPVVDASQFPISFYQQLDPNVKAYVAACSMTNLNEIAATQNLIITLKGYGLYTGVIDALWLMSPTSEACALLNFMDLSSMTNVNSSTWGSTGFTFNGTTQRLNTGYIANNSSIVTGDSVAMGVYTYSLPASGTTKVLIGANITGTGRPLKLTVTSVATQSVQGTAFSTSNQVTVAGAYPVAPNFFSELWMVSKIASNDVQLYANGGSIGQSVTTVSGSLTSTALYIGANNNNGVAANFTAYIVAGGLVTRGLNSTEAGIFATAFQTFNSYLGRVVIAP